MKTSNKLLLSATGILAALILLFVIIFRVTTADRFFSDNRTSGGRQSKGTVATKSYTLTGFTDLEITGFWKVNIRQGDNFQVLVKAPAEALTASLVTQRDRTLILGNTHEFTLFGPDNLPEAEISLPVLTKINASGTAQVRLKNMTTEQLSINFSGAGKLTGTGNKITQLAIECSGAADIDLDQSTSDNANLNVSGAAQIKLNMAGGVLTGQISGVAHVTYTGTVRSEEVKTDGLASVRKKD